MKAANSREHIRQALAKDELTLYCQPIVALAGGGYPLAEILVRMREEEKALLPPGDFLPVFEQYGLMPDLDRWVVRHVLQHVARGSRVPRFSINISGQSLADAAFTRDIARELKAARIAGSTLLFEIDEAEGLAQTEVANKFARGMRAAGCGLMLDGFGRHAASFWLLKALPVDFVKVDGSIVRKLLTDPTAEACLREIQAIGEESGFKLIAEMVEDQDILVRLKALGVAYAQGFGICEPHPLERVARDIAA